MNDVDTASACRTFSNEPDLANEPGLANEPELANEPTFLMS